MRILRGRGRGSAAIALLLAACCGHGAAAAPVAPQVAAGQASFTQQGNVFSIVNTPGTIINWQSFDIGAGEITRFIQQSAGSAVLNRVLGQDPSRILGALQSNGKVFLINPNGILFGQGARVDVNGLVASSLGLSDADFLAGRKNFQAGVAAPGSVRNAGTLATPSGGQVYLIAPQVENSGIIAAPGGAVILAAGHSVQLVDSAEPDVQVVLSAPDHQAVNVGQVLAAGGRIGIYGALVSQRGLVSADSAVVGASGKVVLKASGTTLLGAGSSTSATGSGGADGGTVEVLGATVGIDGGALVDASGRNGGAVLVGGDWQGGGAVPQAQQTTLAAGATLRADGTGENTGAGNGGKVVLWSTGASGAHGVISARGSGAGSGGRVETSGHVLDVDGLRVDAAGGQAGARGAWLLDPYDLEVVAGGTASAQEAAGQDANSQDANGVGGVTRVAPATLAAAGADVVLDARHDLTVLDAIDAAGSVSATAGHDIVVAASVTSGAAGNLDFRAANAFTLGAGATLTTANDIYIAANRMTFAGAIAGTAVQLPRLSLTSADAGRAIVVGANGGDDALLLDPAALARLSPNLFELALGSSAHTGGIAVDGALTLASNLALTDGGDIRVRAPVDLGASRSSRFVATSANAAGTIELAAAVTAGAAVTVATDKPLLESTITVAGANGSVTLAPVSLDTHITLGGDAGGTDGAGFALSQAALARIDADRLTIGGPAGSTGGIAVNGALSWSTDAASTLTLDAGAGTLAIAAPLATAGALALASNDAVSESGAGSIAAKSLMVNGGAVTLNGANVLGTLAGSSGGDFQVEAQGPLRTGAIDAAGAVQVAVAGGSLTLEGEMNGGSVQLDAAGIVSTGSGIVQADSVTLRSSAGIGSSDQALRTRAKQLAASNQAAGTAPIVIANDGALTLTQAVQLDPDGSMNAGANLGTNLGTNLGAIAIDNAGSLSVPATATVSTRSGAIALTAHDTLTVAGQVGTTDGDVHLTAANNGLLAVPAGAQVWSVGGHVITTAGTLQIAPGTIRDVDSQPALATCATTPSGPGCGAVLADAVQACAADPMAGGCGAVVQGYAAACAADPGAAGCAAFMTNGGAARTDGQGVQLAQAQQATVQLIRMGTNVAVPDSAISGNAAGGAAEGVAEGVTEGVARRAAGPVALQDSGAKNDKPATKMYCD